MHCEDAWGLEHLESVSPRDFHGRVLGPETVVFNRSSIVLGGRNEPVQQHVSKIGIPSQGLILQEIQRSILHCADPFTILCEYHRRKQVGVVMLVLRGMPPVIAPESGRQNIDRSKDNHKSNNEKKKIRHVELCVL